MTYIKYILIPRLPMYYYTYLWLYIYVYMYMYILKEVPTRCITICIECLLRHILFLQPKFIHSECNRQRLDFVFSPSSLFCAFSIIVLYIIYIYIMQRGNRRPCELGPVVVTQRHGLSLQKKNLCDA